MGGGGLMAVAGGSVGTSSNVGNDEASNSLAKGRSWIFLRGGGLFGEEGYMPCRGLKDSPFFPLFSSFSVGPAQASSKSIANASNPLSAQREL
jgi:hypothetical protein